MFDTGFAMIFRAVDRIRVQLETANSDFRSVLAEELGCLLKLGDQYIDHWMALDEQIHELIETYDLYESIPSSNANNTKNAIHAEIPTGSAASLPKPPIAVEPTLYVSLESPIEADSNWMASAFDLPDRAFIAFRKGMGYYDLLMFDEAAQSLQIAVDETDHPVAQLYLAAAHAAKQRHALALRILSSVRQRTDEVIFMCAADEIEAQIHLQNQQIHEAIRCLLNIASHMSNYQDVWFNLGICYAMANDLAAAEGALSLAVRMNERDVEAAFALGRVQLQRGEAEAALETCNRAKLHAPRHTRLIAEQARVLTTMGREEQAIPLCRLVLELQPDNHSIWAQYAWLLIRTGKAAEAIAALKKHLSVYPGHPQTTVQLGVAYLMNGAYDRAEKLLQNSLNTHPDKSFVWMALGRISAIAGNHRQAYTRYLRALRDPRKPMKRLSLYFYGLSLSAEGRHAEAEKYLKAALVLGAPNPAILAELSRVVEKLGRGYEATNIMSRASACAARDAKSESR